jgi:hypothetical protein
MERDMHPNRIRASGGSQGAADIDAHKGGAVPNQLTTPSHAAQRARGAFEGAVVRPRKHRQLMKWLDGRSRVIIRSKYKNDPVIVVEVDSSEGRS